MIFHTKSSKLSTRYVVFILDSGSQQPISVDPSQEGMMGEVSGAGGGVGGSSSDTGMASNVAGRTPGSSIMRGSVGRLRNDDYSITFVPVREAAEANLFYKVTTWEAGTRRESGTAGSLAGPGSGQGLQQIPQQG